MHIVIISRWRERYADYAAYLDHRAHRVTYITTEVALASVPELAAEAVTVAATDDLNAARQELRGLAARHGRPDLIVALKEDDLLVAAALRDEWDLPGQRPDDLLRFRDKYVMISRVVAAGLPAPMFAKAPHERAVLDFADQHGWPVIVKPRVGSSSAGVERLSSAAELAGMRFDREPMLVQVCDHSQIYHVDGIFTGQSLLHWRASRYLNSCLGFRSGSVLGSVEEDDPALNQVIGESARQFLAALTDQPMPFHLELFVDQTGDEPACRFLEVGARVGGAEIPFVWRELHGYDLMAAAFHIQLGRPVPQGPPRFDEVGGWLLVPAPAARPCRILEATPMAGRPDGPYAEALLRPGEVLPLADAYYEHVGGRFRFRGATSSEVEKAILTTAADYRVRADPV